MAQYVADVLSQVYFARKCNLRAQYLGVNEATLCFLSTYVIALKPNASSNEFQTKMWHYDLAIFGVGYEINSENPLSL